MAKKNEWIELIKKTKKENPKMSFKEIIKKAKSVYKK